MMINREWITSVKLERRNCGRARSLAFFIELPESENMVPAYDSMVDMALTLYRGAMGDDGRILRNVEVMAWSQLKRRIRVPHAYRVTADFVHEEDMDEEVDSEE
jgi:hypothetical protein